MESIKGDRDAVIRLVRGLSDFRDGVDIRESYPDKNPYEYKAKKEYGNRAYQDGKDIEALYFYTQVQYTVVREWRHLVLKANLLLFANCHNKKKNNNF